MSGIRRSWDVPPSENVQWFSLVEKEELKLRRAKERSKQRRKQREMQQQQFQQNTDTVDQDSRINGVQEILHSRSDSRIR